MVLGRLILGCVLCVVVSSNVIPTYSVYQTIEQIKADGFQPETHKVTTSDGYILEMHRIPHGRSGPATSEDRPVVFLMHGLMSSSQSMIMLGPDSSFAYNLADAGFDVWMGNARGNKNSRFHTTLNPDDEQQKYQFFDFSFEEIGTLDLPAMIDYVLEFTKKDKLHYIGHSQGGTVFLVMASMRPEYNQKLISAHLLAGVGYQEYFPNTELNQTAVMTDAIYGIAVQMGAVELYPPGSTEMLPGGLFDWPSVQSDYCLGNVQLKYMCQLFGVRHIMPFLKNNAAQTDQPGAALKQIAHYGQNIRDKLFRRFHYGAEANIAKYGTAEPPLYDLSLITTFVTMHYTLSDDLLDERDVLAMAADIPKAIARQVARTSFSHTDFVAASDAKELVTDYIVEAINNAGQEDHFTENDGVIVDNGTTTVAPNAGTTTAAPSADTTTAVPSSDTTTAAPSSDTTTAAPSAETTTATPSSDTTTAAPSSDTTTAAPSADTTTAAPGADTTTSALSADTTTAADTTAAPIDDTTSAADTTAAPSDDTTSAADTTAAPSDDTTLAADTTAAPSDDTTSAADTTAAPSDDTTTAADASTTTPATDGAAPILINVYLMVLSLYVMLK